MTKEEVYGYSENWLSTALRLDYEGHKCTNSVLFRVLLIGVGRGVSLLATCRGLTDAPCSRTVYDAMLATLPGIQELEKRKIRYLLLDKGLQRLSAFVTEACEARRHHSDSAAGTEDERQEIPTGRDAGVVGKRTAITGKRSQARTE